MHCRFLFALVVLSNPLYAQSDSPSDATAQLDTVVVTGSQPGPGLWKVSKGDHVLWILGTVSPLPRDIEWRSQEVDALIAGSQEVLTGPEIKLSTNAGFFGSLALLPSLIGLRDNPDDKHLQDVVPADSYARWTELKQRYLGRSNRVEKWRPLFAALALYDAALDKSRLTGATYVRKSVLKTAKRAHVVITTPSLELQIDQLRDAIKEFKSGSLDDSECFRKTLDRITTDLVTMTARANAWATGDIVALRKLPQSDQFAVCAAAVSETNLARSRGMTDLDARAEKAWLDAADAALEHNASTLALLPMNHLLPQDGYLARLRAQGYAIEAPDDDGAAAENVAAQKVE
jgi:uncharacterized protein YbaP (TraB family)